MTNRRIETNLEFSRKASSTRQVGGPAKPIGGSISQRPYPVGSIVNQKRSCSLKPDPPGTSTGDSIPPQSASADAFLPDFLVPDLATAFQPIVDVARGCRVFAHEALVRESDSGIGDVVVYQVPGNDRYAFDQECRVRAIETAVQLALPARLSLNVLPGGVCASPHGVYETLNAAVTAGFPTDRIIFEVTEHAPIADHATLEPALSACRAAGAMVALDNFGAGHAGLGALVGLRPDIIKLDMNVVRGIGGDRVRQAVVGGALQAVRAMDILAIAEGVETEAEARTLREMGVHLMQGFLFARPGIECLPPIRDAGLSEAGR